MLGLKRHTVKLVEHNEHWAIAFLETKEQLSKALANLIIDIQHIGSTSIIGIPAKPILDIAIGIKSVEVIPKCIIRLEKIGYEFRGDSGAEGGFLFVKCSEPDVRTHHIHIVEISDVQWSNYLNFRDHLNAYPESANAYSILKQELAKKYPNDRKAYTNGKYDFIAHVFKMMAK